MDPTERAVLRPRKGNERRDQRLPQDNELIVETERTVVALGALAHGVRLDLVGILAQSGTSGLPAGTIASQLGVAPALISFHLRQLVQAGLLTQRRSGRNMIYAVDQSAMQSLINQLGYRCNHHVIVRQDAAPADATV